MEPQIKQNQDTGNLMEISEQTLVNIVRSQGEMTQAFKDMKDRLDITLPYLNKVNETLEKRIRKVEKKANWIAGLGSGIALMLSLFGIHIGFK